MNRSSYSQLLRAFSMLMEGMSGRAVRRITGLSSVTLNGYLLRAGAAAIELEDRLFKNLLIKELQLDEMWAFVYGRSRFVSDERRVQPGIGDLWTWTAIDPKSKVVPFWLCGSRSLVTAKEMIGGLRLRVLPSVELVSDGFHAYIEAVDDVFIEANHRVAVDGYDWHTGWHTNHAERHNLTLRTSVSRLRRSSNTQSKTWQAHVAHIALFMSYYHFCRIHKTLRVTPAMELGVTDSVWDLNALIHPAKCFKRGFRFSRPACELVLARRFIWNPQNPHRGRARLRDHRADRPLVLSPEWREDDMSEQEDDLIKA